MSRDDALPDSAFVVLALLAEGETHGYELRRMVHDRGFRFWTRLEKTSIYNALQRLERAGLVAGRRQRGAGRDKTTYRLTSRGRERLEREGHRHLTSPSHPRHEVDLGFYALPFLHRDEALASLEAYGASLHARVDFLRERLEWCKERKLALPALAFERPLLALESELMWLQEVTQRLRRGELDDAGDQWSQYEYRDPSGLTGSDAS